MKGHIMHKGSHSRREKWQWGSSLERTIEGGRGEAVAFGSCFGQFSKRLESGSCPLHRERIWRV